ncbi:WbqC family protein [Mycobacterium cookii]
MQPYFFPHLAHFALIDHVDRWVVMDMTQYTPKTWMNRNRVLHPSEGPMYLTVPVHGSSFHKLTREIALHDPDAALRSITGKLQHYRRVAPYSRQVVELVERAFSERSDDSLVALDSAALRVTCEYLSIDFNFAICSELGLDLSGIEHTWQWSLRISQQLGATEYLNPVGGAALFRPAEMEAAGIRLRLLDLAPMTYRVAAPFTFVPSLSVLDVLMWNDPKDVTAYIRHQSHIVRPEDVRA